MRRLFILSNLIAIVLSAFGAKPIEVDVDQIKYRLDLNDFSASIIDVDKAIITADIPPEILHEGMPYKVTQIDRAVFSGSQVQKVTLPNTISQIPPYTFYNCKNLATVELPYSITEIGDCAFKNCTSLEHLSLPATLIKIDMEAFQSCQSIKSIVVPPSLREIGGGAFEFCSSLKDVYITDISSWCLIDFLDINSNPLMASNGNLYENETLIENMIIPNNIKELKYAVFAGCGSIKSVTCDSLQMIGEYAFYTCPHIESVCLRGQIDTINMGAFAKCPELNSVTVYSMIPPYLATALNFYGNLSNAFFDSYPQFMTLYVPYGAKNTYQSANGWDEFGSIIADLYVETGLNSIFNDDMDFSMPMEIFNISGDQIPHSTNIKDIPMGIYIMRQGSKVKKIILK